VKRFIAIALLSLVIAAGTGVLLRFGIVMGMPVWASNFSAIRHAHSHLMYFGWVTLGLMALIWHYLPRQSGRALPKGVRAQMTLTALLALLSFPAFWSNGYGLTQIGSVKLPLGAMVSGFNGLLWLFFAGLYLRATWRLPERSPVVQLWDWAIGLMVLAFGGALGFVGLVMTGGSLAYQQILLHLFLDLFAVGWFHLALLGVLWARISEYVQLPRWLPSQSLAICVVPTFLLGVSPFVITDALFWLAATANLGAALLGAWHLYALWQLRRYLPPVAQVGLVVLGGHIASAIFIVWPGFWQWSAGTQLRIFFLHNFLLGWVSSALLGMVLAVGSMLARGSERVVTIIWVGSVGLMLVALLGIGFIQFVPVPAVTLFWIAAWSSIGPLVVALWVWGDLFIKTNS